MKKVVVVLVIVALLVVSGSAYMNLTRVASELVEVKDELQAVSDDNIRLNSKNEKLNEQLVTYEENLELLENEVKVTTNQKNTLEQQRKSIAKKLSSYEKLVGYQPYFGASENKYPTAEVRFINEFHQAILNGESGFIESNEIFTKKELYMIKRITQTTYQPLKGNLFSYDIKENGIRIIENDSYRKEYKDYMALMNEYYLSIDTKGMTEKEIVRKIARKVAADFSHQEVEKEIYRNSSMAIVKDKEFVCTGYTDIMSVLLDMARIKNSKIISKMKDSETLHIWNKVILSNGEEYYVDLTWADFEADNRYDPNYVLHKSQGFDDGKRFEMYEVTAENLLTIANKLIFVGKK